MTETVQNRVSLAITPQQRLQALSSLVETKPHKIPVWLEDLLINGPRLEQWPKVVYAPNRVIITEFLARWLKFAGLSEDECLQWLDPYACEVLAQYSKSGLSAIRHGTKANTRWVYNSPFVFDFVAMAQEPPEAGFETSPHYMSMFKKWHELQEKEKARARAAYVPPVFLPVLPVKVRFREQFQKGIALAQSKRAEGQGYTEIVRLLQEQGLLTSTGRKWTVNILHNTLRKLPGPAPEAPAQPADSLPAS